MLLIRQFFLSLLFQFLITPFLTATPLTLEEQVGQLLMVHFNGKVVNEEARILIEEVGVGGIIYYNWANGLDDPEQVLKLSTGLQELAHRSGSGLPLFIATDQEGGVVARLKKGVTIFPGNGALGSAEDPQLTRMAAMAMGTELQALGINMNLAPVVDVNINPCNPIIGIRSFGNSPEKVAIFGQKALEGYKQAGIMAVLKHFPGHGDVAVDSHQDLPMVQKPLTELKEIELYPFASLSSMAEVIMTAHLLVPALDPDHCSTLSKKTLDYLRNEMGFQGMIMTDSLVMEGVLKNSLTLQEVAVQALNAGCDLLLLGGKQLNSTSLFECNATDIRQLHKYIVRAVQEGRIPKQRIEEAVDRVLALKRRYLFDISPPSGLSVLNCDSHCALAHEIASKALKVTAKKTMDLPFSQAKKVQIFIPRLLEDSAAFLNNLKGNIFLYESFPSTKAIETAEILAEEADFLVAVCYNTWKSAAQISFIHSLINTKKPLILLVMGNSLDLALFPQADLILTTYGPSLPSFQIACEYILNL